MKRARVHTEMRSAVLLLFALSIGSSSCSGSGSSDPAPAPAKAPVEAPASAPAKGPAIHVRVLGTGRPMILVPGLASPGEVWRGAEQRFSSGWQLHIVTLAGFAGEPPIAPPLLESARAELVRYIETEKLDHPVLVGHSLGATVVFLVAGSVPDEVGPIIALDGVPYGAALSDPQATPDAKRSRAEAVRARVRAIPPDQIEAQARQMFTSMVTDPEVLDWLMVSVVKSDPSSVGQAMYELMTTDARPSAAAIHTPVLMMVAGQHFEGEPEQDTSAWEEQLAPIPSHRIVVVPKARHFVMLDAPDFVYGEIERFLATN